MKSIKGVINWGIIGCGDVCEVKSGPAFNKIDRSRLVAVMRRDLAKAEDYAKRHRVPRFYNNPAELINDPEVNAIYIATPPSSHEAYTEQALSAGKPVYVEKPVSLNADSCQRMIEMSKKYDNKVSVAHYRRALPLFRKVKQLIGEGVVGKVRLVQLRILQPLASSIITKTENNWRINPEISGGGLFHDLSPHQLDIIYWIFGRPVQVSGVSLNQSQEYEAPDVTRLEAIFGDQVSFSGLWAFNVAPVAADDSCEIIGDKGKLRFAFFRTPTLEVFTNKGTETLKLDYPVTIQQPMIESVATYFRDEGPNPCSLEEALEVMRMIDKAHAGSNK